MQDLHSIRGGAPPRFFPTGLSRADATSNTPCPASFVDRRLRPSPHQNLKCPRCDSPNTKFCYYNNYNLSQPRHFCKSCRRYWTKGGVLRNVPVGGGCRKPSSKRSSNSVTSTASSKSSSKSVNSSTSSRSSGSCDNSSALTSTTITTTTTSTTTTAISTTPVDGPLPATAEIFPASTATDLVSTAGYSFPDLYSFHIPQPQQYEAQIRVVDGNDHVLTPTVEEITIPPSADRLGFMDQTVPADLPTLLDRGNERSDQLATIDWQGCLDATVGLFDSAVGATGVGDQGLLWSHGQWADVEPTTYFP